jgi:membrane fusion protein
MNAHSHRFQSFGPPETDRPEAPIAVSLPSFTGAIGILLVVTIAAGLAFLCLTSFARKETATGWLVPENGLIRATARASGIIASIDVTEGAYVAEGQVIARIRSSLDGGSGDTGPAIALQFDRERQAELDAGDATQARLSLDRVDIDNQILGARTLLASFASRIALAERRGNIARAQFARKKSLLDRGYTTRGEVEALMVQVIAADDALVQLRSEQRVQQDQLARLHIQRQAKRAEAAQSAASRAGALAALDQRRIQTAVQSGSEIRAPVSGRIAALTPRAGQAISANEAICAIVPRNSALQAEVFVSSRGVGFVRPGNDVRLRYQAFPFEKFGAPIGRVIAVSQIALPRDAVAVPGVSFSEPMFKVTVALPHQTVIAYGRAERLQASSLLTAELVTDRRSLLEWLLDPLFARSGVV